MNIKLKINSITTQNGFASVNCNYEIDGVKKENQQLSGKIEYFPELAEWKDGEERLCVLKEVNGKTYINKPFAEKPKQGAFVPRVKTSFDKFISCMELSVKYHAGKVATETDVIKTANIFYAEAENK